MSGDVAAPDPDRLDQRKKNAMTPATSLSFRALQTLADIRENELWKQEPGVEGDVIMPHSHDQRFVSPLVRRGFVQSKFVRSRHLLVTTKEGREFIATHIEMICEGLSDEQRVEKLRALGVVAHQDAKAGPAPEKKRGAGKYSHSTCSACGANVDGTHICAIFEGDIPACPHAQERDELKTQRDALIAERDELKAKLEVREKELAASHQERDHGRSQLIYAHRLAATGAKLDDMEKMRVVFGLIMSETKPLGCEPLPRWWNVGVLGVVTGAYLLGLGAPLGGVKK